MFPSKATHLGSPFLVTVALFCDNGRPMATDGSAASATLAFFFFPMNMFGM